MKALTGWLLRHRVRSVLVLTLGTGLAAALVRSRRSAAATSPMIPPAQPAPVPAKGAARPTPPGPAPAIGAEPGPYPGSVLPLPDGSSPDPAYVIKANTTSMLCHDAASPYYRRTRAALWFRTQDDAISAGFRLWSRR